MKNTINEIKELEKKLKLLKKELKSSIPTPPPYPEEEKYISDEDDCIGSFELNGYNRNVPISFFPKEVLSNPENYYMLYRYWEDRDDGFIIEFTFYKSRTEEQKKETKRQNDLIRLRNNRKRKKWEKEVEEWRHLYGNKDD